MATARRRPTIARPLDRSRSRKRGLDNHGANSRNEPAYAHARKTPWVCLVGFRRGSSRETRTAELVIHLELQPRPAMPPRIAATERFLLRVFAAPLDQVVRGIAKCRQDLLRRASTDTPSLRLTPAAFVRGRWSCETYGELTCSHSSSIRARLFR